MSGDDHDGTIGEALEFEAALIEPVMNYPEATPPGH
jgi:hypothetical protein